MQSHPQLTLPHGNGYKVLAETNADPERRLVVQDLQDKLACVGAGELDTTVDFADRADEAGTLGRNFNRMVEQLRDIRDENDRLHRNEVSRTENLAAVGELAAGLVHELRNGIGGIAGWTEIVGRDLPVTSPAHAVIKDAGLEIARIQGILTNLLQMAHPHRTEFRSSDLSTTVEGGHDVQFVEPGPEVSPDLRIDDLGIPFVIECKFQSRWSQTEEIEISLVKTVFDSLCSEYAQHGMTAALDLTLVARVCDINAESVLEDAGLQLDTLVPYGTRNCTWGTLRVLPVDPVVEWSKPTRLYSPNYLSHVFHWNIDDQWDGICATVQDEKNLVTQRARLPFCLKWRLTHRADEWSKARDVMRSLQEAANQVPVGEVGCLYVGFEDSHRSALADLRTRRNIERMPNFYHRKRGANIAHLLLTRLYPRALEDGKPDLVESCISASRGEADEWPDFLPTTVFVPEPT